MRYSDLKIHDNRISMPKRYVDFVPKKNLLRKGTWTLRKQRRRRFTRHVTSYIPESHVQECAYIPARNWVTNQLARVWCHVATSRYHQEIRLACLDWKLPGSLVFPVQRGNVGGVSIKRESSVVVTSGGSFCKLWSVPLKKTGNWWLSRS